MALLRRLRFWHLLVIVVVVIVVFGSYAVDNARNSTGPLGERGRAMLNGPYWGIQFEIDYMPGVAPDPESLNRLRGFVFDHTDKIPLFVQTEIRSYAGPEPMDPTFPCLLDPCPTGGYTLEQIVQVHQLERNAYAAPGVISVHILYADRPSSEGQQVGASAYCATCIVMFEPGAKADYVVEAIILAHEFAHLLGLCAVSYEDVRAHCDDQGHSRDSGSLMYYAPNFSDPDVQALRLNADELADLKDLRTGAL